MPKATFTLPDDFLVQLSKLGDKTDEIIPRVLEAGGEVVLDKVKSNLGAVVGHGTKKESRSTGTLVSALGMSPPKQDHDGNWNIKVGFAENRTDGKSNALIANVLEYGKHGQPPKPFLKPAKTQSKSDCINAMEQKFSEEVGNI